jgi:hypothetical protein
VRLLRNFVVQNLHRNTLGSGAYFTVEQIVEIYLIGLQRNKL